MIFIMSLITLSIIYQSNFPWAICNSISLIKSKYNSLYRNALSFFFSGQKKPLSHLNSGFFFYKTSSELKLSFIDIGIAEIIIFDRYLNNDRNYDRKNLVESYISNKWDIEVQT